jgi:Rad3-related DNA helicase
MFKPERAILISADSIEHLRRCDVFRMLEWSPAEHRAEVADYILANRPEFAAEVGNVLSELAASPV